MQLKIDGNDMGNQHRDMKIGINVRCLQKYRTGLANYTINLLMSLCKISENVEFYLFSPRQDNYVSLSTMGDNEFIENKVREVISWPLCLRSGSIVSQLLKVFWEKIYLTVELNKYGIDVFHDPTFSLPFNYNKPKVVTVHDMHFRYAPKAYTARTYHYHNIFLRDVVKRADVVIAVSESAKTDIVECFGINEDKIRVIYEGVNEYYLEKMNMIDGILELQKLDERIISRPYLLSVSAMNPRKNIPNIIRAFNMLIKKHKELHLVLVGQKAWGCKEIDKLASELALDNRIIFTGYVDDKTLKCLYMYAKAFLYPSFYEGFGLPLLEAMACGTPIVTSNLSSMPEVVGRAGLLVDPHNYFEIAEAIDLILTDSNVKNKLVDYGKEQVRKYNWLKAAEQTLDVYRYLSQCN